MPCIVFSDPHIIGEVAGGAETQIWLLAMGFKQAGWDVHYVTDTKVDVQERGGIRLHTLSECPSYKHYDCFRQTLRTIGPNVIYQRGRKSYTGLAARYASEHSVPMIFATSMDVDCQRNKQVSRALRQPRRFLRDLRRLPELYKQDRETLAGMSQASIVFTQTLEQQSALRKILGTKSVVIRNLHPVPPERDLQKKDSPVVLWLASVKQWKRPELFLKLAGAMTATDCRFVMAGRLADRDQYARLLRSYANGNGKFRYIEHVDLDESNRLIAEASIFVNTSRPFEGFPNTFVQSWLRRTIVVSLLVDPDGFLRSQNIGRRSGSIGTMITDIQELLEDEQVRLAMGERSREFAIHTFGFDRNFPRVESLVRELL